MNIRRIKNEEPDPILAALEDGDDNSEAWSLPEWPELESARHEFVKRQRRIRRLKRKRIAELKAEAERIEGEAEALGVKMVTINASLPDTDTENGENGEDDDEDLPESMKNRGKWNNHWEFLLSIISMSVGMGNFYRFPFVAYQNGGGAFLLPYLIVLTFIGRPMYVLELAVGQFNSYGQVKCWEMSPFFRGVGYGSAVASFAVVTFYSSVMAITFYYLFNSFRSQLPWAVCDPEWAGKEVCAKIAAYKKNHSSIGNGTVPHLAELYFQKKVTGESATIDDGIGTPLPIQTACLVVSWIIIFLVIAKGVESTGRTAWFTTLYPYVIILIMLIAACTKDGAWSGILYFLTPQWDKIIQPSVWFAAVGQCFFSLSTGFGPIINYASYNPFHHHIYRDAMIVSFMDTLASMLAGFTVFATLGTIAHNQNQPISKVVTDGPGLVFVSFSDAIAEFKYVPQLVSVLFYVMLLSLAIGSAVAWQMAAIQVICDEFPRLPKIFVSTSTCIVGFLLSLIYVTPGGQFMFTLIDNFGGNINIYILATLECIGIAWVYGLKRFCVDIQFMLNMKVSWFWKMCWGFVIPVILTMVMISTLITAPRLTHGRKRFPDSAIICGWILCMMTLIVVPIWATYEVYKAPGKTVWEKMKAALRPSADFGPRRPHDKERWELFKKGVITKGGPAPDTYVLPEGQTPESHTTLPDWLTVTPSGEVLEKENALRLHPDPSTSTVPALEKKSSKVKVPKTPEPQKDSGGKGILTNNNNNKKDNV